MSFALRVGNCKSLFLDSVGLWRPMITIFATLDAK